MRNISFLLLLLISGGIKCSEEGYSEVNFFLTLDVPEELNIKAEQSLELDLADLADQEAPSDCTELEEPSSDDEEAPLHEIFDVSAASQFASIAAAMQEAKKDSNNRWPCPFRSCPKSLTTRGNLRTHVQGVHFEIRNHSCQRCTKRFKKKSGLEEHVRGVHDKIKYEVKFFCDICEKGFTKRGNLNRHNKDVDCTSNRYIKLSKKRSRS